VEHVCGEMESGLAFNSVVALQDLTPMTNDSASFVPPMRYRWTRIWWRFLLGLSAFATGCGDGNQPLSSEALARCGSRGNPVTLAKTVEVFRANGITLYADERKCEAPDLYSTNPDATNFGSSGLKRDQEIARKEGDVLCHVGTKDFGRIVEITKYPTDEETYLDVLNVDCSVYPYNSASEAEQVGRVKRALEALVRETS
jgi:hypothetical protein